MRLSNRENSSPCLWNATLEAKYLSESTEQNDSGNDESRTEATKVVTRNYIKR